MSIRALSLGGHDRYTPEIRDRILEKNSALEIVRSAAAHRLLASIGPMAAVLRW